MDLWEKFDRMIDEQCKWNKEQAKLGRHNYGPCCLCGQMHFVETEPNLNRKEENSIGSKE